MPKLVQARVQWTRCEPLQSFPTPCETGLSCRQKWAIVTRGEETLEKVNLLWLEPSDLDNLLLSKTHLRWGAFCRLKFVPAFLAAKKIPFLSIVIYFFLVKISKNPSKRYNKKQHWIRLRLVSESAFLVWAYFVLRVKKRQKSMKISLDILSNVVSQVNLSCLMKF